MAPVIFHLHGRDPSSEGVIVKIDKDAKLADVKKLVASKLSIAVPNGIVFAKDAAPETLAADLETFTGDDAVAKLSEEKAVGILIDGKTPVPVPGPTSNIPFIGGYGEIYPDFLGNYQRLLDKWGHMVHVAIMGKNVYLTDDPEVASVVLQEGENFQKDISPDHPLYPLKQMVPEGLFTADSSSPSWALSHKLLMSAMSAKAMRHYVTIMDHSAKSLNFNIFKPFAKENKSFDVFSWTLRAASNTIGEVTFNQDFGMLDSPDAKIEGLATLISQINRNLHLSQELFRKGAWYRALPNPEYREQKQLSKKMDVQLHEQFKKNAEQKKEDLPYQKASTESDSLLDFMLHAVDDDGSKLSMELIMQNVSTFLGAGQVTTSSALAWIMYTLSHYPEYAEKLYWSLIDAGLEKDGEITSDLLSRLDYLDWFIKETQRLYNPAFQPTRQARKEVIVPGGYIVPKGAEVTVALHSVHVNKEHWSDPWRFNPDRWGSEEIKKRHPMAFIPFAAGTRGCIGFNFALQEIKLIISRLVLNFTVEDVTGGPVVYDPGFSLYRPLNFKAKLHFQPEDKKRPEGAEKSKDEQKEDTKSKEDDTPQENTRVKVGSSDLPKLWVLYGSNNGTTKGFASELAARAKKIGFTDITQSTLSESVLMKKESIPEDAEKNLYLIVCCSYNGEAPDNALDFDEMLDAAASKKDKLLFQNVRYAVFGAGNKQWGPTYQAIPKKIDVTLSNWGATRIYEKGSGDASADQEGDFSAWSTGLWADITAKFGKEMGSGEGDTSNLTEPTESPVDAVKIVFSKAKKSSIHEHPPLEGMGVGVVQSNVELVDKDSPQPRAMRLVHIQLPKDQDYRPGDHIEIFPENEEKIVDDLIALLGLIPEAAFQVDECNENIVNSKSLAAFLKGKGVITVKEALQLFSDLSGPVSRQALQVISALIPDDEKYAESKKLFASMGSPSADKAKYTEFSSKNRNIPVLFGNYPRLKGVIQLPQLLMLLNCTQPRRYSIASSPLVTPGVAAVCTAVVEMHGENHKDYEGLSSGFLKRSEKGSKIWVKTRQSQESFHLPDDPKVPVIMIAAGSGIAPFLGFLEHRKAQGLKDEEHGGVSKTRLYYGVSYHDMSAMRENANEWMNDGFAEIRIAYSANAGASRKFAQDLLVQDGVELWDWIENGAHIYVCGSAVRVGAGVRDALTRIAQQVGAESDPGSFTSSLARAGRFSEDVFG